jgi:membrane protease YdiL (CAAX protease family)
MGIAIAAGVFGLAHGSQPQVVPALTLFGVILGLLHRRTGSLIAPIVAHGLFNAKTLLWETLRLTAG